MKLLINLIVFYKTICLKKNHNLELNSIEFQKNNDFTEGKLSLILHGKTTNKFLTFDQTEFRSYQSLTLKTDFNEDITSLTILWKSASEKSIFLNYLNAKVDDEHYYVFSLAKHIQSGCFEELE